MINPDERDRTICTLLQMTVEAQTWTAALKELLIAKGITTEDEFARYVASGRSPEPDSRKPS